MTRWGSSSQVCFYVKPFLKGVIGDKDNATLEIFVSRWQAPSRSRLTKLVNVARYLNDATNRKRQIKLQMRSLNFAPRKTRTEETDSMKHPRSGCQNRTSISRYSLLFLRLECYLGRRFLCPLKFFTRRLVSFHDPPRSKRQQIPAYPKEDRPERKDAGSLEA